MSKHLARIRMVATLIGLVVASGILHAQALDPQARLKADFGITVDRTIQGSSPKGIVVHDVGAGSPAAQAGFQKGDVITQVGRRVVEDFGDLANALRHCPVGQPMTLHVRRDDQEREYRIGAPHGVATHMLRADGEGSGQSPFAAGTAEQLQRLLSLVGQRESSARGQQPMAGTVKPDTIAQERVSQRLQRRLQQVTAQAGNQPNFNPTGALKGGGPGQDQFARRLQNRLRQIQSQARIANRSPEYGSAKGSAGGPGDFFQQLQNRLEQLKSQAPKQTGKEYGALKGNATVQEKIYQRLQARLQQAKGVMPSRVGPKQVAALSKTGTVEEKIYHRLQTRLQQQLGTAGNRGRQNQYGAVKGNTTGQGDFVGQLQGRLEQLRKQARGRAGQAQYGAFKGSATVQDKIFQRLQTRLQQMTTGSLQGNRPRQLSAKPTGAGQDLVAQRLQGRLQQLEKQAGSQHAPDQYGSLKGAIARQGEFAQRLQARLEQIERQAHHPGGQRQYGALETGATVQDRVFQRLQKRLQQLATEAGSPNRSGAAGLRPMETNSSITAPFFGVQVREWMPNEAQQKGGASEEGVVVTAVDQNSPAAAAGIHKGDVILRVNGKAMSTRQDLRQAVQQAGAGHEIALKVLRDNQPKVLQARLESGAGTMDQARLIQQLQNRLQRLENHLQNKRDE